MHPARTMRGPTRCTATAIRSTGPWETAADFRSCAKPADVEHRLCVPKPIRATTQKAATDVFGRIANKSPVRGAVRGSKCTGMGTYYRILDFIDSRCRDYSGRIDRALVDGRPFAAETDRR